MLVVMVPSLMSSLHRLCTFCETSCRSSATVPLSGAYNFNKRLHDLYKVRTFFFLFKWKSLYSFFAIHYTRL